MRNATNSITKVHAALRLLCCLLLCSWPALAVDYGELSVKVENLSPGWSNHGYTEYRATLVNHSATNSHRVTLLFPDKLYLARGDVLREITRTVEVAPEATAVVSFFKSSLSLDGDDVAVIIDGQRQEVAVQIATNAARGTTAGYRGRNLLVSPEVKKSNVMNVAEEFLGNSADSYNGFGYTVADLPSAVWSNNWLGYSGYDGVIVTGAEINAMPAAVKQALLRYVECGGALLVFGEWPVPPQWQARLETTSPTLAAIETEADKPPVLLSPPAGSAGQPEATPTPTPTPTVVNVKNDLRLYYVGFGALLLMGEQPQPQMTKAQWQAAEGQWRESKSPFDASYYYEQVHTQLPVVEKLTVPVRGLFLLMLLFVLVIGPLNLVWLARRGKRIWLLWTVPALALLTSLAVAGYATWSEGIAGHARAECLTILDEAEHRATTLGFTAFYSPLTPSDGLHFGYDTEITPVPIYGFRWGGGRARTLDWTSEQHLATGWLAARVPAYFQVRKSETRRERLSVNHAAGGAVSVVNGLGAPISKLWWTDEHGRIHQGEAIAAGAAARLTPTSLAAAKSANALRGLYSGLGQERGRIQWLHQLKELAAKPEQSLAPGCYLALLESAPFIEAGLRDARERKARTLVYGVQAKQ